MQVAAPLPVGVILAGGASARFGGPKGLALMGGARIIDRVAHALRAVSSDLLLVANDPDADGWLPGVPRIADRMPGGGGLSGVHAALVHTLRPVLVVAWDMPFVTPALLGALARRCAAEAADACVPDSASPVGMEPFCACYAPSCLPLLEQALRVGDTGAARFAGSLPRLVRLTAAETAVFGPAARLFFGVNSRDDLERAEALAAESQ
ncbi:MAG: hypothetical protein B7Z72_00315 [Gemmatimonadetes bacterium 21-71-4]|nr:MAG: hypothetical protein B7Z72_00315 [Gemmatimonadetes bacterium 21-71-4]